MKFLGYGFGFDFGSSGRCDFTTESSEPSIELLEVIFGGVVEESVDSGGEYSVWSVPVHRRFAFRRRISRWLMAEAVEVKRRVGHGVVIG
ncbi:hypothetical protein HID58_027397 [Brassica napus]|uniref:Uncharacterized protein n=1 Tax=Brassica napus TaxID=3708 RepID=A0ABQ8CRM4_BRANA|nr:hypothetical protein HID58_027397 [Brassica napus]